MAELTPFDDFETRLQQFHEAADRCDQDTPAFRALSTSLILLKWEGTPRLLLDKISTDQSSIDSNIIATLNALNYQTETIVLHDSEVKPHHNSAIISIDGQHYVYISTDPESGELMLYDYFHDLITRHKPSSKLVRITQIKPYSKIFREPPPQSSDRSNWVKYCFFNYKKEIRHLIIISFFISVLGSIGPFFIMGVYNFALTSGSHETLMWITTGAIITTLLEYALKRWRVLILTSSGTHLSKFLASQVLAKLLWLPYKLTSGAGLSAQLARLKDIDQFRRLVTSESTLSYLDMPFVVVFIIALFIMAGMAALPVVAGIAIFIVYGAYSRFHFMAESSKSSKASVLLTQQWFEALRNISTIQGLPLQQVATTRFNAVQSQKARDSAAIANVQGGINISGGAITQFIGTTCIVATVLAVFEGNVDGGAMIAMIILVWKALGPLMGIYNSLSRFTQIKNSANQINRLMAMDDERSTLEKSIPLNRINGELNIDTVTLRHPGSNTGLTQLSFRCLPAESIAIVGPSGCGKTTLLDVLGGILENYQGKYSIDGYNVRQFNGHILRRVIAYKVYDLKIFTDTLRENFIFYAGNYNDEDMEWALKTFNIFQWFDQGLDTFLSEELIRNLPTSVIEKLRLSLVLTSNHAGIILLDEPLSGCDPKSFSQYQQIIARFCPHATIVMATNTPKMVSSCNYALLLDNDGGQKYFGIADKVVSTL